MLSYILQIITIMITLGLGLFSAYQTKKLQHGQNIISVTTNYRMKRCEQLKEFGQTLMCNTTPKLLVDSSVNEGMMKNAYNAAEAISMVMHRYFDADKELIDMAERIAELAFEYSNAENNKELLCRELIYRRKVFKIKCDIYTSADWHRIKCETEGVNTTAESWIEYHKKIQKSFEKELIEIENEYESSI